jgi:hypothetical protein
MSNFLSKRLQNITNADRCTSFDERACVNQIKRAGSKQNMVKKLLRLYQHMLSANCSYYAISRTASFCCIKRTSQLFSPKPLSLALPLFLHISPSVLPE